MRRWFLLLTSLTLVGILGAPFAERWSDGGLGAQTPTRPEIVSLEFEGNDNFSGDLLEAAILTRRTSCRTRVLYPFCWGGADFALDRAFLNPGVFGDDFIRLNLLYQRAGYRGVQIDTVVTRTEDNRAEILFQIEEGEPHRIATLDLLGLEGVTDPSVTANLPVELGDPLDFVLLDAARDTLTERLRNEGYAHAEVFRNFFIPAGSREAEVEFDVYTGPVARFGEITITGNGEVAESVILRMLPFREGSPYNRSLLFEAQRNIYSLEIFQNASVVEVLDNDPLEVIPIRLAVTEGLSHRVRTEGGWDTAECLHAEARWSSLNFFGGARRLVVRGRASNLLTRTLEKSICAGAGTGVYGELNWGVSADFTQPFIFSPRNSFAASIYAERQSLQDVFVRRGVGLNLSLSRTVGRASLLTLSYRPQLARLDAAEVFFCTNFLICNPGDIDLLQAANLLSPVGLSFYRDRTNRLFSPTGGYTLLVDFEHASAVTGSDYRYNRALGEATGFFGLWGNVVLAGRLRGGWLAAGPFRGLEASSTGSGARVAHPQKRFFAGGSNSVRGFAQNQLGPQVVSTQVENLIFPAGGLEEAVCTPQEIVDLVCDASPLATANSDPFFRRPTGGNRLLEGSVELRFPLWGSALGGAAFVDFGRVRDGTTSLTLSDMVFTPGIGLRYDTPIGPLRVDLAYRNDEMAPVQLVTTQLRPFDPDRDAPEDRVRSGELVLEWVRLEDLALLGPRIALNEGGGGLRRLQLHLSIGQAF